MASYSASTKKLVLEQLLTNRLTLEQVQQEYSISRTTLFRWLAQYRSTLNQVNDTLTPSALSDFAHANSAAISNDQQFYGHSKVEHNHEIIKIYCKADNYEHKLSYAQALANQSQPHPEHEYELEHEQHPPLKQQAEQAKLAPQSQQAPLEQQHMQEQQHSAAPALTAPAPQTQEPTKENELPGFYREFKLSELLQAAIKAQMSLWHGPKCEEITRYYGISMEQLRHFYELVLQEGLVSGSLYGQMQHQLVAAQEQLANYEQKIKVLEAKEQLYRFYLDAFKKQSALYKLDFNSLNDALKQDFLSLIQQLKASGMTTQEAADMLGINMRTYYRWLKQVSPEGSHTNSLSLEDSTDSREIASNSAGTSRSEVASLSEQPYSCKQAASEHNNINHPTPLVAPNKTTASDKVLHVDKERPEYKFISTDEIELIKEIVLLPEYQGLNVRDCYHKLKDEQLLTMSLSTFYRTINQDPSLKAALKGKLKQSEPTTNNKDKDCWCL